MGETIVNILIAVGVLTLIAVLVAVLLAIADKYLTVSNDKEEYIDKIEFYLPSYNCGVCGHVNCRQVAKKMVDGTIKNVKVCKVISEDNANLIRNYCKENKIDIE